MKALGSSIKMLGASMKTLGASMKTLVLVGYSGGGQDWGC